jgi:hypothetical protein
VVSTASKNQALLTLRCRRAASLPP